MTYSPEITLIISHGWFRLDNIRPGESSRPLIGTLDLLIWLRGIHLGSFFIRHDPERRSRQPLLPFAGAMVVVESDDAWSGDKEAPMRARDLFVSEEDLRVLIDLMKDASLPDREPEVIGTMDTSFNWSEISLTITINFANMNIKVPMMISSFEGNDADKLRAFLMHLFQMAGVKNKHCWRILTGSWPEGLNLHEPAKRDQSPAATGSDAAVGPHPTGHTGVEPEPEYRMDEEENFAELLFCGTFGREKPSVSTLPSIDEPSDAAVAVGSLSGSNTCKHSRLVLIEPDGKFLPWELTEPYYSVGRVGTKIKLDDPYVSRWHLAVVRIGGAWLAINLSQRRMHIGGWPLVQKTLRDGDAIRIGTSWLAFVAGDLVAAPRLWTWRSGTWPRSVSDLSRSGLSDATQQPYGTIGSLEDEDADTAVLCTLLDGERELARSTGQPLLIGSDPGCPARVDGPGVAPFHAALWWTPEGVRITDLESGHGLLIDGQPTSGRAVRDGQILRLGDRDIRVQIAGDPSAPARERLRRARAVPRGLVLTVVHGTRRDESIPLPEGRPLVLGSDPAADLALPGDRWVSGRHLELTAGPDGGRGPTLRVRDLGSESGAMVNRRPVEGTADARAGDVIQFGRPDRAGPTAILVHYPLGLDRWEDATGDESSRPPRAGSNS